MCNLLIINKLKMKSLLVLILINYTLQSLSTLTNSTDEPVIKQNGTECYTKSDNNTTYCLVKFNTSQEYYCMPFDSDYKFIFNKYKDNIPYLEYNNSFHKVNDIQCDFIFNTTMVTCGQIRPNDLKDCRQHSFYNVNTCCYMMNMYDNSTYCALNPKTLIKNVTMNGIIVECSSSFLIINFIFMLILII
jgi:hypothetical protein